MWIIANSCSVDYTVLYTHTTSRQNVPWCSFERPCSAARSMPYTLSAVKYVKLQQSQSGVYILHLQQSYHCLLILFSERELTFTFAICYRPSVCRLSVVCLSSVTLVRPTQAVQIFRNISTAFGTLAIH